MAGSQPFLADLMTIHPEWSLYAAYLRSCLEKRSTTSQRGTTCHEVRIRDRQQNWRLMVRIDDAAIVIVDVSAHKSRATPLEVIDRCRSRLRRYDEA